MDATEVQARMGMKPPEIVSWHDMDDGVLVVTREGAQTLLLPDGGLRMVDPRRDLPSPRIDHADIVGEPEAMAVDVVKTAKKTASKKA